MGGNFAAGEAMFLGDKFPGGNFPRGLFPRTKKNGREKMNE